MAPVARAVLAKPFQHPYAVVAKAQAHRARRGAVEQLRGIAIVTIEHDLFGQAETIVVAHGQQSQRWPHRRQEIKTR